MKKTHYSMSIYQKKYRRGDVSNEIEEIDITSLLDILVILLVFLLKSYNASDLKLDVAKNLQLADSNSRNLGKFGLNLQITKNKDVFVQNGKISNLNNPTWKSQVRKKLNHLKQEVFKVTSESNGKNKDVRRLNIVLDKSLKYHEIDSVLKVAGNIDFTNFHFVVMGTEAK